MFIDFGAPLLTLKGAELKEQGDTVNLGTVLCNLMAAQPSEAGLPVSERRKRFVLSVRIVQAAGPIDVDDTVRLDRTAFQAGMQKMTDPRSNINRAFMKTDHFEGWAAISWRYAVGAVRCRASALGIVRFVRVQAAVST